MSHHTLQAEVTGTVWQVTAEPGSHLDADATIVIVESMKMEIPVTVPFACRVVELLVAEGERVDDGQAVAILEAT